MFRLPGSIAAAALIAGACAGTTAQPTARPEPITAADVAALTELMQHEDTRSFDAAAFDRLASAPSQLIRTRTMLAAGRIGNRAAANLLLRGLADPSDSVRTYAAFALGELGDSSANVAAALGTISTGSGAAAREAIAALGKIGGSHARPFVENVLRKSKSGPEAQEALLAMWRFPRTPATSALIRPLTTARDEETRWRAVYALTRGGPDPANNALFQQLARDANHVVRSFAVRGLRASTADSANARPASAGVLVAALRDSHEHVRINAVGVLAGYRDPAHGPEAARLLNDPHSNVRVAAAQALGLIKGPAAASALETKAGETSEKPAIRGAALASLALVDRMRALPLASAMARSADPTLRVYAARSLANIPSAASLDELRTLASDRDIRVQVAAVGAVAGVAGDTLSASRAFFMERLGSSEPYVRAAALGGLQRLAQPGDEAVVMEALEFALRDRIEDAAVAAIEVLGKLAQTNPAIARTFATRFPISRIPLKEVRQAAIREMKLSETCCAVQPRPAEYARIVRDVLVPALTSGAKPRARVTTSGGSFEIELLAADAPITVDNFVTLARRKYFDNGRWHRVVPNFVLQDGDPTGMGNGGPGYAIRDEMNRVRYLRGTLGMALSGPDTGGSQWFITHSPHPHLDGGYTVFGRVTTGMEVADGVVQDDPITSIEIIR
jgi:cyclophilin family peptidyl-prolyl cis-trans isomerase/HEAT repeat protein